MDNSISALPLLETFALLENTRASRDSCASFLFTDPCEQIVAHSPDDISSALVAIDMHRKAGHYLCGYVSYEAGYYLVDKNNFHLLKAVSSNVPLINFLAFTLCARLTKEDVDRLINEPEQGRSCAVYNFNLSEGKERYLRNIEKIRKYIRDGDTYQVNHTLKYHFNYDGSPLCLYRELRNRQSVEYGAFLNFPEARILSLSPELFLQKKDKELISKPMKGTARRGKESLEDNAIRLALKNDPKTLSENVMIVDLIRNDIGRIADPGSVQVKNLFEVQSFETIHQMISTVCGTVPSEISISKILYNLFPCGSITGAPKIRTMEIIEEIEQEPRGVYTGAIGYITPTNDFCFNVPIRTIVSTKPAHAEMGIGSGIIYEADGDDEFRECILKAKFLTGINEKFQLIETMLYEYETGIIQNISHHLSRLENSAAFFGFTCNLDHVISTIHAALERITVGRHKIRLLLSHDGSVGMAIAPVDVTVTSSKWLMLSPERVQSGSVFQFHKTTMRSHYERAYRMAVESGAYDTLFLNEKGEIAEASRHNIFIVRDGEFLTPPVTAGILAGIGRAAILGSSRYASREAELSLQDIATAERIYLSNSVRGLVEVAIHPTFSEQLRK